MTRDAAGTEPDDKGVIGTGVWGGEEDTVAPLSADEREREERIRLVASTSPRTGRARRFGLVAVAGALIFVGVGLAANPQEEEPAAVGRSATEIPDAAPDQRRGAAMARVAIRRREIRGRRLAARHAERERVRELVRLRASRAERAAGSSGSASAPVDSGSPEVSVPAAASAAPAPAPPAPPSGPAPAPTATCQFSIECAGG